MHQIKYAKADKVTDKSFIV